MADEIQAPSEEQLADVKAKADAELAKWEGDFPEEDLAVPYKHDDKEEKKDEKADDVDTKVDKAATEKDTADEAKPEDIEELPEMEQLVTVADPGEFTPSDHSFEVTLADGKTHKVSTPEEAEKIADDPENFETPKQLMEFINKQNRMNSALDKEREKWQAQKEEYDSQTKQEAERLETIEGYVNEFNYLVQKGLIPEVSADLQNADWADPEVAKQPGVKEQQAILDYMVKENKTRAKAGVKPITSIVDAYNAWKSDQPAEPKAKMEEPAKPSEEDERKAAGEARRAAGAKVSGVSASNQPSNVPKGIAVGNPNVFSRAAIWDD